MGCLSGTPWKDGFPPSGSQATLAVPPLGYMAKSQSSSQKVLTGPLGSVFVPTALPGLHICKASPLPASETAHETLATDLRRGRFLLVLQGRFRLLPPLFCASASLLSPGPTEAPAPDHTPTWAGGGRAQ